MGYGGGGGGSYISPLFTSTQSSADAASGDGSVVISVVTTFFTEPVAVFAYTGNVQTYTVPAAGSFLISAVGAGGGTGYQTTAGEGASESGTIALAQGFVLDIVVGEAGPSGASDEFPGAGGGGTFVESAPEPTSLALFGAGAAGLAASRRNRRRPA